MHWEPPENAAARSNNWVSASNQMVRAGGLRILRVIQTIQEVSARCELPRHKTEQCPVIELERTRLLGTMSCQLDQRQEKEEWQQKK